MAHVRITFDVDPIALFNRLQEIGGATDALAIRLIHSMMTGETPARDVLGLALYGVSIHSIEKLPAA